MNQRLLSLAIALVALGMGGKTACMNQNSGEEITAKIQRAAPLLTRLYGAYKTNPAFVVEYDECINQQKASLVPDDFKKIEEERTKLVNIIQEFPDGFCSPSALKDRDRLRSCDQLKGAFSLLIHDSSLSGDRSTFNRLAKSVFS